MSDRYYPLYLASSGSILADADIMAAALTPYYPAERVVITVQMSAAGVLKYRDNATDFELNEGEPLEADKIYEFCVMVRKTLPYNFRYSVAAFVEKFAVDREVR